MDIDNKLIFEEYSKTLNKKNILDEIYFQLKKGMDVYGFFGNSKLVDNLVNSYEDSVEYRQKKSKIQNEIKSFIEERFLSKIKDLPYNLSKIATYISIEPERNQNFKVAGFTDPVSKILKITIYINNVIKNGEDFKNELYYVLVHELVHARQIYDTEIEKKELQIPRLGGRISKKLFEEYYMHPSELEAYAIEYNYRNKNNPSNIFEFAKNVVDGFDLVEKDSELMEIFLKYVEELKKAIKKYPWKEDFQ